MESLLQSLLDWIALHPYAFNAAVFCISFMEGLVVLGLLIPGAALLFGAGALIATGTLPLYPILFWTVAGAIAGDVISYYLGHHYHQRLRVMWPFRRYPTLVNNGVDFFTRHGGKSIFMARFIGPLRPIVPAIAGMMNMPTTRFLLIDIVACILWAPVYILPGLVFGASLGLAAEVAGRLVVLLVTITGFAWLGFWLVSNLIRLLQPHANNLLEHFLAWSRNHPLIKPLAGSLLDPDHPEARGLTILSILFFITLWLLLWISIQVLQGQLLGGIDAYVFHTLDNLRTPWFDHIMVFFTLLGNPLPLAMVLAGCTAWLLWKKRTTAALHWLAAYASAGLLTWILKITTQIDRPLDYLSGDSFPSAHTSMSIVVFGFMALLIARELPHTRRWLPYFTAGLLIAPIMLSRIYLGAHWFSDVLAGLCVGIFWVALIGIAYDRHPAPRLPVRRLALVAAALVLLTNSWQLPRNFTTELARFSPTENVQTITRSDWLQKEWKTLPAYRFDLEGKHTQPVNLQWGGSLKAFQQALARQGWQPAAAISPVSAMNWLAPEAQLGNLPVLPEVNDGQHQALLLIAPLTTNDNRLTVVRLWPSGRKFMGNQQTIWIGKVASLYLEDSLPLVSYLRSAADYATPLKKLVTALQGNDRIDIQMEHRELSSNEIYWQGDVLLAWELSP